MTSPTKPAVGNASPVAMPATPAPKKEEGKGDTMQQVVTNALAESAASQNFGSRHAANNPAKKIALAQQVLHFEPVKIDTEQDAPPFNLGLTKHDQALIDEMFGRWALKDSICLLELWGLDLYADMQELGKYLPKEEVEKILERFCADFVLGYVSLCAERNVNRPKALEFGEKGVKSREKIFVRTRRGWTIYLAEMKEALQTLASSKMRVSTISTRLKTVKKKLELGEQLLLHPHAGELLADFNLRAFGERFKHASKLNSSSPHKTLEDLARFAQFISYGFESAIKLEYLGLQSPSLGLFAKKLAELPKNEKMFTAVKQLKKEIAPVFADAQQMIDHLKISYLRAVAGELTPEKYYPQMHRTSVTGKKSANEFASQLFVNMVSMGLLLNFFYDFCDILDERVMEPLYPEIFVPTTACANRFNFNLGAMFVAIGNSLYSLGTPISPPPPPSLLSSHQKELLVTIANKVQMGTLFLPHILQLPFHDYLQKFKDLQQGLTHRFQPHTWLPLIKEMEPLIKITGQLMGRLDETRSALLKEIEDFLRTLDPQVLSSNRAQWTGYFKELSFQGSLDLCRLTMITQDMKAIMQLHVNMAVVNSEEHLLPEPLVDFMELEGIDQLFSKLLTPHHPMIEDLEDRPEKPRPQQKVAAVAQPILAPVKPAPPKRIEKVEKDDGKTQPSFPRSSFALEEAPAPFVISRGEKTRKILSRLRALGFLPVSQRGSHRKLEDEKGQPVIVPVGGKRAHQKRGTGRSIASQASGRR